MTSLSCIIKKELSNRLNSIGFKKNKMVFIREINKDISATLVPTSRCYKDYNTNKSLCYIGLDIGVSFHAVNTINQLLSESDTLYYDSVIHSQIGYLMPTNHYKEWSFVEGEDTTCVFDDMFECIDTYASSYYHQMSDLNYVFETIKTGEGILHISRDRYLPILYYLRGDKQSGLKVIEEAIERQLHPKKPEVPNIKGAQVELFVGLSYGRIDPSYLTFAENYRNLPEPNNKK